MREMSKWERSRGENSIRSPAKSRAVGSVGPTHTQDSDALQSGGAGMILILPSKPLTEGRGGDGGKGSEAVYE